MTLSEPPFPWLDASDVRQVEQLVLGHDIGVSDRGINIVAIVLEKTTERRLGDIEQLCLFVRKLKARQEKPTTDIMRHHSLCA
jgi:hypothetical protein